MSATFVLIGILQVDASDKFRGLEAPFYNDCILEAPS